MRWGGGMERRCVACFRDFPCQDLVSPDREHLVLGPSGGRTLLTHNGPYSPHGSRAGVTVP